MDGVRVGDWLCKIGGGVSRRSNSANPSGPAARLREPLLLAVAEVYDAVGQPAYVRVPSMLDLSADRLLQAHGWVFEGESLTLVAPLPDGADAEIALAARPSADWLAAMNAINGRSLQAAAAFEAILGRLAAPAAFASVRREGAIVSGAYGALYDGWLCIEGTRT